VLSRLFRRLMLERLAAAHAWQSSKPSCAVRRRHSARRRAHSSSRSTRRDEHQRGAPSLRHAVLVADRRGTVMLDERCQTPPICVATPIAAKECSERPPPAPRHHAAASGGTHPRSRRQTEIPIEQAAPAEPHLPRVPPLQGSGHRPRCACGA
jgi:hypothetical protein